MKELQAIRKLVNAVLNLNLTMQTHELKSIVNQCDLGIAKLEQHNQWISVEDRPIAKEDSKGNWVTTEAGNNEFIAAVPLSDGTWWIRHCVMEDVIGLCVVGGGSATWAGWEWSDITHWQELPKPPQ